MKILSKIQRELKAPKNQMNKFGGYRYRSCEDILESIKPLLGEAVLIISDEIVLIGERYYVRATATLSQDTASVSVSAYARESLVKKGMDESQITGAASSYARKYALNGLFCIDDTKNADDRENTGNNKEPLKETKKASPAKPNKEQSEVLTAIYEKLQESVPAGRAIDKAKVGTVLYAVKGVYPDDIKKAGSIASWLISQGKMDELTVEV